MEKTLRICHITLQLKIQLDSSLLPVIFLISFCPSESLITTLYLISTLLLTTATEDGQALKYSKEQVRLNFRKSSKVPSLY
ncbi:hypothetical protein QV12_17495 [Pseudomonas putida]|nr:hypothetical protein QV12_17495 [Pseudomonas putida]RRW61976.1 hypothetical protein EGJ51_11570 [Pseudomonas fulva]